MCTSAFATSGDYCMHLLTKVNDPTGPVSGVIAEVLDVEGFERRVSLMREAFTEIGVEAQKNRASWKFAEEVIPSGQTIFADGSVVFRTNDGGSFVIVSSSDGAIFRGNAYQDWLVFESRRLKGLPRPRFAPPDIVQIIK